ncbi:MAG: hypothetical protein ACP5MM_02785, partial [Acidithiobacillus sp.]|uniref:hypothetical protein n=1 Tax=Acidithiobacillus sp. TaxID=1872118 RepID=UPI003D05FDAC
MQNKKSRKIQIGTATGTTDTCPTGGTKIPCSFQKPYKYRLRSLLILAHQPNTLSDTSRTRRQAGEHGEHPASWQVLARADPQAG